jgi:epoxyqueuosine reductase
VGLNLVAAVPAERYDPAVVHDALRAKSIAERVRSIIVLGNGGRDFWAAFRRHADANPGWLQRAHPLDDFTRIVVERDVVATLRAAGVEPVVVYPFARLGPRLDFVTLGRRAGLVGPSILGVTVHPTFGPWVAFRAALLVDRRIDAPGEALGFDPCPSCRSRSCIAACPVGAVRHPQGWDVPSCARHRVEAPESCESRCHARVGCVLGPEHRYTDDELAHHQRHALPAMQAYHAALASPRRSG